MKYKYFPKFESDKILKGSSEEEIIKVNNRISPYKLPTAYLEFLRVMGSECFFLIGESFEINKLEKIRNAAESMLNLHNYEINMLNNPVISLKESDFVFFMSQGTVFFLFDLIENNGDPKVYRYTEFQPQHEFLPINKTFSEFILDIYSRRKIWA